MKEKKQEQNRCRKVSDSVFILFSDNVTKNKITDHRWFLVLSEEQFKQISKGLKILPTNQTEFSLN